MAKKTTHKNKIATSTKVDSTTPPTGLALLEELVVVGDYAGARKAFRSLTKDQQQSDTAQSAMNKVRVEPGVRNVILVAIVVVLVVLFTTHTFHTH